MASAEITCTQGYYCVGASGGASLAAYPKACNEGRLTAAAGATSGSETAAGACELEVT
jgi:hypothetical protein